MKFKIFLHDTGNNLKNFSSNDSNVESTTIIAEKGIVERKELFLLNGKIISNKKLKQESEIIKFEQLSINLRSLNTTIIKKPKLQETSTFKLLSCFFKKNNGLDICEKDAEKEITPILIRRLALPAYIPVLCLICSFLMINKNNSLKKKIFDFFL